MYDQQQNYIHVVIRLNAYSGAYYLCEIVQINSFWTYLSCRQEPVERVPEQAANLAQEVVVLTSLLPLAEYHVLGVKLGALTKAISVREEKPYVRNQNIYVTLFNDLEEPGIIQK